DCYKDIREIVESFHEFAKLIPRDGLMIISAHDARIREAVRGISAKVETCCLRPPVAHILTHPDDWKTTVVQNKNGAYGGEVTYGGKVVGTLALSVPGEHNLINATMALAACHAAGADT